MMKARTARKRKETFGGKEKVIAGSVPRERMRGIRTVRRGDNVEFCPAHKLQEED